MIYFLDCFLILLRYHVPLPCFVVCLLLFFNGMQDISTVLCSEICIHYAEWFEFTFYLQTNTFSPFLHLTGYFIILDIGLCMRVWCEQHRRRKPRVWLFKPNFLPYMENIEQDSIVREVDNIIQWISLYLVNSELRFVITYPLDGGLFVKMELSALYYDFNRTIL